jgi:hypothetical protein
MQNRRACRGLAMVNVANGANVQVGFISNEFFFFCHRFL